MPGKNLEKIYVDDSFYHVYNRGVNKRTIYYDEEDYRVFLNLFKRHLSNQVQYDKYGREYPYYRGKIELISYCLMPNHFHCLIYAHDAKVMTHFVKSLITSYAMYFNRRYKRVGHLFQDRFRASLINEDNYLWHISRYIHLNPIDTEFGYKNYPYSSYKYYLRNNRPEWLVPDRVLEMFKESRINYQGFVKEYESKHQELKEISQELY